MDKQKTTESVKRFVLPAIDAMEIECYDGCLWISQYESGNEKQIVCIPFEYLNMVTDAINKALAEAGTGAI